MRRRPPPRPTGTHQHNTSNQEDEPGERFDGGTAATWATRSHRAFTVHSVAVAAARAVFRAVSRDSRRARRSAAPPSAKFPHKFFAHNPRNTARRASRMNDRVA